MFEKSKLIVFLFLILPILLFANAGIVDNLKGDVSVLRDGNKMNITKKFVLQRGDIITTLKGSVAKLVFRDGTIITLGKNSKFTIDEYLYQKSNVKAEFSIPVGVFKAITGKIAKLSAHNFKLRTKTSSIGIRGTKFYGIVPLNGKEEIYCNDGEISVRSKTNRKNIFNVPSGFMTFIDDGIVKKPIKFASSDIHIFEEDNFNISSSATIYPNTENSEIKESTNDDISADDSSGNSKVSNVVIDSNVKDITNIATGNNNIAEQNVHSISTTNRGQVEYVYIKGKANDVSNIVHGSNNKGKSSIGSIKVK